MRRERGDGPGSEQPLLPALVAGALLQLLGCQLVTYMAQVCLAAGTATFGDLAIMRKPDHEWVLGVVVSACHAAFRCELSTGSAATGAAQVTQVIIDVLGAAVVTLMRCSFEKLMQAGQHG